jgi:hypothetical protein
VTIEFLSTIRVRKRSVLSHFLFATIVDKLTCAIQEVVPWCMLFADDIVLIVEIRAGVNVKLELWRRTLKSKGFRISRSEIEYIEYKFSIGINIDQSVTLDGRVIPVDDCFLYLGSIIQKD